MTWRSPVRLNAEEGRFERYVQLDSLDERCIESESSPRGHGLLCQSKRSLAVLIIGPTCSGKTEAGEYASNQGFRWIEPSTFLGAYIPLSVPLLERLSLIDNFFRERGTDCIANWLLSQALLDLERPIVITGCRQLSERDILSNRFRTVVVAIESATRSRYERTKLRARDDAPPDFQTFIRASAWEYSLGLGRLTFEADHILVNDGSLAELRTGMGELLRSII